MAGLIRYLYGPGRREEHTDPHIIAGYRQPADLEPSLRASGSHDFRRLAGPAPQDLRRGDRRHGHRLDLDVGAPLISVDLEEHAADAQGRALVMGDDNLDLLHVDQYRGTTTDCRRV